MQPRFSNFRIAIEADIISKIPYSVICSNFVDIMNNFPNVHFAKCNDLDYPEVDILLGAEYVEFVSEDRRQFVESICLCETKFGWVISGALKSSFPAHKLYSGLSMVDIDSQLKHFFDIEDADEGSLSKSVEISSEYKTIENHFESTHEVVAPDRFQLKLQNPVLLKLSQRC